MARTKTVGIVSALTMLAGAGLIAFSFYLTIRMNRERDDLTKLQRTIFYACGYTAGQRAIMERIPTLFDSKDLPQELSGCVSARIHAHSNGFNPKEAP